MNKKIMCGACGQTHSSVEEVRLCHGTKKEVQRSIEIVEPVVKKPISKEKDYEILNFETAQQAEAFVKATPKTKRGKTMVKYLDGVGTTTYQVIRYLK